MGIKKISARPDTALVYLKKTLGSTGISICLAQSQLKARVAQTRLRYFLSFVQIILGTALYWLIFGIIFKVDTQSIPYPVFLLPGLISWQYFSSVINDSAGALINGQHLINKIYFPRVHFIISKTLPGLIDFGICIILTLILIVVNGINLHFTILLLPVFVLLLILSALSLGIFIASISVKFRDISRLVPFLVNFGFFITPVFYPSTIVPGNLEFILYANPVAFVVEGLRFSLLGSHLPSAWYLLSLLPVLALLFLGWRNVRRNEKTYADII